MKLYPGEVKVKGCRLLFRDGIGITPRGTVFDTNSAAGNSCGTASREDLRDGERRAIAWAMVKLWAEFGDLGIAIPAKVAFQSGGPDRGRATPI